jgi:hypothetical protein
MTRIRISQLGLALPLILAAAPMHRGALPIPPIPPDRSPTDGPAPIPDRDAAPPSTPPSEGTRIVPRLVRVPTYANEFDQSEGYINGSRLQQHPSDRRIAPSPGFNLQIPFK